MILILWLVFIAVLLLVIFPTKSSKINIILMSLLTILLIIVAGFREGNVDRDYDVYKYYWNSKFISYDVEYSFVLIRDTLKNVLGFPLTSLFLLYAILGVTVKIKAIQMISGSVFISVLLYISNYYLVHELTQIRAGVAAAFFLISIKYIYERNLFNFILFILIASFFHYSAFMALPLWFLKPDDKKIKYFFYLIPLGFLLYFMGTSVIGNIPIPYVQNRIQTYEAMRDFGIGDKETFNIFSMSFLSKVGIFLLIYFNRAKLILHNKYTFILLKIYAISLFVFPVLSEIPAFSYRVQSLFGVVDIILVPLIAYLFRYKFLGTTAVVLIAAMFFAYNLFISELVK